MKNHSELNILQKSALGAAAVIISATAVFGTVVHSVKASELSKKEVVKTEYASNQSAVSSENITSPENFVVDYKVILEEGSPKADANAVSADEAAKAGVQDLKRLYGLDSKGKTISMYYCPIGDTSVRAEWLGNVLNSGDIEYYFSIDAVTGNIGSSCRNIKLNKKVNVAFDKSLMEDSSEYKELTIKAIEDYNILPEKVVSVEYISQGYTLDNPDIQMTAVDASGNEAQLSFSRYDQELLQVCYDNWVKMAKLLAEKYD